jgi:hypothetical protein
MRRPVGVVLVLAAIAVALLLWRCHRATDGGPAATSTARPTDAWRASSAPARARPDPKTPASGSLAGTITDATTHAPIAGADVCADGWSSELTTEQLEEPFCARSDASGRYQIGGLLAATYIVHAAARTYRPEHHHPGGDSQELLIVLAAAQQRTGIDVALHPGAVEITGTVADLTGGPIAHARVHGGGSRRSFRPYATAETDERGRFSLWVRPGTAAVAASADGYASQATSGKAPGTFELLLIPEASVAGTVVDAATGQPIAGARVTVTSDERFAEGTTALTGPDGTYRAGGLSPGRFSATARSEHAFGRTEGSVLVGIGQRIDGANIKMSPALHVEGKLVIAGTGQPCADGDVELRDAERHLELHLREMPFGIHTGDGALPGTYAVTAQCQGFVPRSYPPIAITDKDVTAVWEVDRGATVRGKVTTRAGEPIDGARIIARPQNSERFADGQFVWSGPDGSYALRGMQPGSHRVEVTSARAPAPEAGFQIEVAAGAVVERNLVLDDGGTIQGTVVDPQGAPVAGMYVQTRVASERFPRLSRNECRADGTGAFACIALAPGDYRVSAASNRFPRPPMPGSDDGGQLVTVRANETATVKLVVAAQSGAIKGTVLDSAGKPIQDAFVSAARETEGPRGRSMAVMETRWSSDARPILSAADGSFTVPKLAAGKYTLRAYRRGGGEAIAQHAETGSTVTLQIAAPGTIEGTARRGGKPVGALSVSVSNLETGLAREEQFFQTGGHYIVRDLPRGHLVVNVESDGARKTVELDLADGERKTLDADVDGLVTVTGRVVEKGTAAPVRGVRMVISAPGSMIRQRPEELDDSVSDERGRFTLRNVSPGKLTLLGIPPREARDGGVVHAERTIEGTGTVDIGDVELEKRAK